MDKTLGFFTLDLFRPEEVPIATSKLTTHLRPVTQLLVFPHPFHLSYLHVILLIITSLGRAEECDYQDNQCWSWYHSFLAETTNLHDQSPAGSWTHVILWLPDCRVLHIFTMLLTCLTSQTYSLLFYLLNIFISMYTSIWFIMCKNNIGIHICMNICKPSYIHQIDFMCLLCNLINFSYSYTTD